MTRVLSIVIVPIALVIASQALGADGQQVYSKNCAVCHNNLDPKLGDKTAWAPLLKQGDAALTAAVINGKGQMPARGGNPNLSDDDIKAAVGYMESKAK